MNSKIENTENIIKQLLTLEPASRALDTNQEDWTNWMALTSRFSSQFLNDIPNQLAQNPNLMVSRLREPIPEGPTSFEPLLLRLQDEVLTTGLNASSGRYMAYVPGGGIPSAAIADFLAALTNRYSGNFGACPAAAEIENTCVRWLLEMVGLSENSWGVLTSGGTVGAMVGLVAARNSRPSTEWHKGIIYVTSECHHSIAKVLHTIGLGDLLVRKVSVDSEFRMNHRELAALIKEDQKKGFSPWIVCVTAGTTNSGAVDPIAEISKICRANNLWLHVDGAYGGFFVLTDAAKPLLKDMALGDSIVLDPHKSFFLPYGCGAVLVRDGNLLRQAFSHSPDYLKDLHQEEELSPSDFSIEGTRHFRGLRFWLSLKIHGVERFKAALEEKLLLAQYAYQKLSEIKDIEVGPAPQLSCVTFRIKDKTSEASDTKTQELLNRVQSRAIFFNSSTRLGDHLYLRLCILNFRTHREEIDLALREIEELTSEITD